MICSQTQVLFLFSPMRGPSPTPGTIDITANGAPRPDSIQVLLNLSLRPPGTWPASSAPGSKYGHWTNAELPETSDAWFDGAKSLQGSWWPLWDEWVTPFDLGRVPPRFPRRRQARCDRGRARILCPCESGRLKALHGGRWSQTVRFSPRPILFDGALRLLPSWSVRRIPRPGGSLEQEPHKPVRAT
jgi:hypothetical protein